MNYCDAVGIGHAEDTWPALIEDVRKGRLQRIYQSHYPALNTVRIDRSIFRGKKYGPLRLIQFGRGCRQGCAFCSIHAFYGNRIRYRPVDKVIAEIQTLGSKGIIFTDDNFFADKACASDLLNRLKALKVRWSCQAGLETAADDELLKRMTASGCLSVTVGFESLNDSNLDQMRKSSNQTSKRYEKLVRKFHDHGIMVYGSFIFGYDSDTVDDFKRSLDFVVGLKLFLANFNPLTPMPGTPLYARLREENRLIYDPWWLDPEYRYGQATFHPRGMSADELTKGCYWARTEFNRIGNIAKRALNFRANTRGLYNTAAYLAGNYVNRREIHRKQGLPLGHPDPLESAVEGQPI